MSEKFIDISRPNAFRQCASCLACKKAAKTAESFLAEVMDNSDTDSGEVLIDCLPAGNSIQNSVLRNLVGQVVFLKRSGPKLEPVVIHLTDHWIVRCPGHIADKNLMHEKSGRPDLIEDISLLVAGDT